MRVATCGQLTRGKSAYVGFEVLFLVLVNGTITSQALLLRLAQIEDLLVELDRRLRVRDFAAGQLRRKAGNLLLTNADLRLRLLDGIVDSRLTAFNEGIGNALLQTWQLALTLVHVPAHEPILASSTASSAWRC